MSPARRASDQASTTASSPWSRPNRRMVSSCRRSSALCSNFAASPGRSQEPTARLCRSWSLIPDTSYRSTLPMAERSSAVRHVPIIEQWTDGFSSQSLTRRRLTWAAGTGATGTRVGAGAGTVKAKTITAWPPPPWSRCRVRSPRSPSRGPSRTVCSRRTAVPRR